MRYSRPSAVTAQTAEVQRALKGSLRPRKGGRGAVTTQTRSERPLRAFAFLELTGGLVRRLARAPDNAHRECREAREGRL